VIAAVQAGLFVPGLIVGVIIGFICMRAATSFQGRYGRPPWGVPGWGWFLIGFILGLVGLILYLIAHATSKRQAVQSGSGYPPPAYPPPQMPPPSWSQQAGTPPPPPPPGGGPPPYPGAPPPAEGQGEHPPPPA
jgi:hypothetical protein